MMKVAFDTNVVLDAAMNRPDSEDSLKLVKAVVNEEIVGLVSANTITDIHYIVKKRYGDKTARAAVQNTLYIFDVIPVDGEVCMEALGLPMGDYEDAVLAVCADRGGAECIATKDAGFINAGQNNACSADVMKPSDILAQLERE